MSILQWNCRGLLCNYDDVYSLLEEHHPIAFCLQETHLKQTPYNFLKPFHVFRKDRPCTSHASGGVAVIIPRSLACVEVPLNTQLEAVAARILGDRLITVCSLYIPPTYSLRYDELEAHTTSSAFSHTG